MQMCEGKCSFQKNTYKRRIHHFSTAMYSIILLFAYPESTLHMQTDCHVKAQEMKLSLVRPEFFIC